VNTALSYTQLNATANVTGTFVYTPPLNTILNTAGDVPLSVTFTPTDIKYPTVSKSVVIKVVTASTQTMTASLALPTSTVQYSDPATFSVTVTSSLPGVAPAGQVAFRVGTQAIGTADLLPVGNPQTTTTYQAVLTKPMLEPSPYGTPPTGQMQPGMKIISASMLNPDPRFTMTNPTNKAMSPAREDARVAYTGTTALSLGGSTTVPLKVLVTEPADGSPGDLRTAQVLFYDRGTGVLIGTSSVAQDGTAIFNWPANLGGANSKSFTLGFVVAGYYTRNNTLDNASVTVSK
jgi:hypothetical protein